MKHFIVETKTTGPQEYKRTDAKKTERRKGRDGDQKERFSNWIILLLGELDFTEGYVKEIKMGVKGRVVVSEVENHIHIIKVEKAGSSQICDDNIKTLLNSKEMNIPENSVCGCFPVKRGLAKDLSKSKINLKNDNEVRNVITNTVNSYNDNSNTEKNVDVERVLDELTNQLKEKQLITWRVGVCLSGLLLRVCD